MGDTPAVVTIRRRTTEGTTMDHRLTEAADTRAATTLRVTVATTLKVTVITVAAMVFPEGTITCADADIDRVTPEL